MNRYTWYQAHDWTKPYPGDTKIYAPTQVPGGYLPSADTATERKAAARRDPRRAVCRVPEPASHGESVDETPC